MKRKSENLDTTVLVRRVDGYDRDAIRKCVLQGMKEFRYDPHGSVFVKPNVVFAAGAGSSGTAAYTDPAVLGSTLLALSDAGAARIDVGEKTAIGYPTRLSYRNAGYYREVREAWKRGNADMGIFCIEEERRQEVFIGGIVHESLRIPRKMARADSLVYLPKLKCHCVSTMTGAVKLNVGICCDDERSRHHDYLLDDKIVDLLSAAYPDFIVMDAIDVGVGNEAVPLRRKLGLLIMGRNPMAVDLVGARLLGSSPEEVPYLRRAIERGYGPGKIKDITLIGDITSLKALDDHARRHLVHDEEFYRWQDIDTEFKRLGTPLRFYWGPTRERDGMKCRTGCVMGLKMFFGFIEQIGGPECFARAKPSLIIVGKHDAPIDAAGADAFLIGSCTEATVNGARKIHRIDHCYTTAVELSMIIRGKLGLPAPIYYPSLTIPLVRSMIAASFMKSVNLRYLQDAAYFLRKGLLKRL
ncbi:MAG: DUF362 domain-containing protein [Spirochaetes bacterium]|nr:DUF362 domain-containing protein [Spirochaetota bacterium]